MVPPAELIEPPPKRNSASSMSAIAPEVTAIPPQRRRGQGRCLAVGRLTVPPLSEVLIWRDDLRGDSGDGIEVGSGRRVVVEERGEDDLGVAGGRGVELAVAERVVRRCRAGREVVRRGPRAEDVVLADVGAVADDQLRGEGRRAAEAVVADVEARPALELDQHAGRDVEPVVRGIRLLAGIDLQFGAQLQAGRYRSRRAVDRRT